VGRAFTNTQGLLLQALMDNIGFDEAVAMIGVSKQAGSQAIAGLREHGLITKEPERKFRRKLVAARKDGEVRRWASDVGDEWSVTVVPIGRFERHDLMPERAVVLLKNPLWEAPLVCSYRSRLSYEDVERQLKPWANAPGSTSHGPAGWPATVRVVTEMVAHAMGLETLLPAWFLKEDIENGGHTGEDTGRHADAGSVSA
jgi:hypothetical protein